MRPKPHSLLAGFTVVELLVVMIVIGVLSTVIFTNISDARKRSRDTERASDIDLISSRLEEYYNDKGGYPNTFTAATLGNLDPAILKDPNNVSITIASAASDQYAARAVSNPTSSANYKYIPYPSGCNTITCTGYVLKAYIEQPSGKLPDPYTKYGLNNN